MKKTNITSRDVQAEKTRKRIFETAFAMFKAQGFDNVTVDDICKKSDVAKGSFYHHFRSKADIIIEHKRIDEIYMKKLMELPAGMNSVEKLIFTLLFQARYAKRSGRELVRQLYKSQMVTGTYYFTSEERPFYRSLMDTIADGQKKKEIRKDLTADEITKLILIVSRGILYDWCLLDGEYDIEHIMARYFRILVEGLGNGSKKDEAKIASGSLSPNRKRPLEISKNSYRAPGQ